MSEWICRGCGQVVAPENVTYNEYHDTRGGGCGGECEPSDESEVISLRADLGRCVEALRIYADKSNWNCSTCKGDRHVHNWDWWQRDEPGYKIAGAALTPSALRMGEEWARLRKAHELLGRVRITLDHLHRDGITPAFLHLREEIAAYFGLPSDAPTTPGAAEEEA